MPTPSSYPGVYVEEVPSRRHAISGVATSIALFVGWAGRGSQSVPTRLAGFADYERHLGGLDARSLLGHAVKHFFDNGGSVAYVLRIASADAALARAAIGDLAIAALSSGGWAADYQLRLRRRADAPGRFGLDVLQVPNRGAVVESFENLSMNAADPRFVERVVNGRSAFVVITAAADARTPDDATIGLCAGTAGSDGSAIGPADPAFQAAVRALFDAGGSIDGIDVLNIVAVPGLTDAATIAVLQAACHRRRAFLIVDAPEGATVATMRNAAANAIAGAHAMNSALYFPWLRAADPLHDSAVRSFPPSGFVAGVYARSDATRGVWKAPAGSEWRLAGTLGPERIVSDAENGLLNQLGINCLCTRPGLGTVVWGARTLHGQDRQASEWKYVSVRRLALFIEESLDRGTRWARFEPSAEPAWAQVRRLAGAFMLGLFRQGAFQGASARDAYFVRCDGTIHSQTDIALGTVNMQVGFAALKPAEFVVVELRQLAGRPGD